MTDTTSFTTPGLDSGAVAAGSEKAKAMFGEINARAKGVAEKSAKFMEELSEITKGNAEAMVASAKIAASGAETIGADAAAYGKKSLEHATGAIKGMAAVKSPTELFQLQSDYAKSSFDAMVAETSKMTEAMVKLAGEMFQPISSRLAVTAEKIKGVTTL